MGAGSDVAERSYVVTEVRATMEFCGVLRCSSLIDIGVAGVQVHPRARIRINFAFVGLTLCCYRHYAAKNALGGNAFPDENSFWGRTSTPFPDPILFSA